MVKKMPRKRLNLELNHSQFQDLDMALEEHRDGLIRMEQESALGLGLEPAYWRGRVKEVEELRKILLEDATEDFDRDSNSR